MIQQIYYSIDTEAGSSQFTTSLIEVAEADALSKVEAQERETESRKRKIQDMYGIYDDAKFEKFAHQAAGELYEQMMNDWQHIVATAFGIDPKWL